MRTLDLQNHGYKGKDNFQVYVISEQRKPNCYAV